MTEVIRGLDLKSAAIRVIGCGRTAAKYDCSLAKFMHVDFAFFDGDTLLLRGFFHCETSPCTEHFAGRDSHEFTVTHRFEEPACPIEIECRHTGKVRYTAALRMGVHNSDDWEAIDLGNIHTFAFRCSSAPFAG